MKDLDISKLLKRNKKRSNSKKQKKLRSRRMGTQKRIITSTTCQHSDDCADWGKDDNAALGDDDVSAFILSTEYSFCITSKLQFAPTRLGLLFLCRHFPL